MTGTTVELGADGAEAVRLAKADFNFLAALVDPHAFKYLFPNFYIALFHLLTRFAEPVEQFAIGIPRGFAKTTYIKLLCVWYILFTDKKFILVVGAAEKLALNTVADICDMLGSSNIRKLFGHWDSRIEEDTKEQKVFYFRGRYIILKGIGAGTSIRGVNRKNERPDVILMDDVQKKEDAENQEMAAELLTWILGTLGMARSNDGCTYIYVGNMYPRNCILDKLRQTPEWTSLVVGGILEDGTSLWEELKPLERLLKDYQMLKSLGQEEIFVTEILNSTDVSALSGLDLTLLKVAPAYMVDTEPEGSFILIDPSSGKKDGDDCTIEHYSVVDSVPIFDQLESGTWTPLEVIKTALNMGLKRNTRLICVEDVAYQSTLLFWFNHVCKEMGLTGFEIQPVSPKNQAKNSRIKKGLMRCIKGETLLHPDVVSTVKAQATDWNPLTVNNKDDIIDPLGYVDEVLQKYPEFVVKQTFETEPHSGDGAHDDTLALPF